MKIGVIGGTFDPIHNGHLAIAEETKIRLALAEVLFVPAGLPWLKTNRAISAAEHRVAMVRLAIRGIPCCRLSTVEIDRPGPSYTVDTIAELRTQFDTEVELFFILGWDGLAELPEWHEPSRLIDLCSLVAVPRPGWSAPDIESLEAHVPGISQRVILLDGPLLDISATTIRQKVAQSQSIDHLVPEQVAKYIMQHGLYHTLSE